MNDNKQHPNDCGEFDRLAMRITAELWGPLQFNPDFRAPESVRYVEELTLAHNADCAADKQRIAELERQLESFKGMSKRLLDIQMRDTKEICDLKDRIAELETALDTAMHWFEDEVPPNIIEELRKIRGEQ